MDEPDWDSEAAREPDWVYDAPGEPDWDEGAALPAGNPVMDEIRQRHPKAYDRWTRQADSELVRSYLAGRTIDELAVDFERQPSAIQRRLERLAFAALTRHRAALRERGSP